MKKIEKEFEIVNNIIEWHWNRAVGLANAESLMTYWAVGAFVSERLKKAQWGSKTVEALCDYLKMRNPKRKGYGKRNVYNMVEFYEAYSGLEFKSVSERLKLHEFVQMPSAQIQAENPSVGIILCPEAGKYEVKYAIDRTMSPMMIAEYKRLLIPEEVMKKSLEEYCTFMKKEEVKRHRRRK